MSSSSWGLDQKLRQGRLRPTGQGDSRLAEGKGDLAEAANRSECRGPALPVVRSWSP